MSSKANFNLPHCCLHYFSYICLFRFFFCKLVEYPKYSQGISINVVNDILKNSVLLLSLMLHTFFSTVFCNGVSFGNRAEKNATSFALSIHNLNHKCAQYYIQFFYVLKLRSCLKWNNKKMALIQSDDLPSDLSTPELKLCRVHDFQKIINCNFSTLLSIKWTWAQKMEVLCVYFIFAFYSNWCGFNLHLLLNQLNPFIENNLLS